MFHDLIEMALNRGLSNIEHIRDGVKHWLNIGPSTSHRVPYGYSTPLMQLHVDSDLNFYLEVLNRLVHTGTIRCPTFNRIDHSQAGQLLDSLDGGLNVCQGRADVPAQLLDPSQRKQAIEQGLADGNFISYPDYRYRSHDCKFVVDGQDNAIQCPACAQPDDPRGRVSVPSMLDLSGLRLPEQQRRRLIYTPTTEVSSTTTSTTTTTCKTNFFSPLCYGNGPFYLICK